MKVFKIMMFGLILCLTFTSCSKTNVNNGSVQTNSNSANKSNTNFTPFADKILSAEKSVENVEDYNKLFELNLYSDKQTYKTTDKIKIWATLKYIGNSDQVRIWHASSYIGFTITDGKKFEVNTAFNELLTSTVLDKDKLYKIDYAKSGGYSEDDPDADFWRKFLQEENLYLPKGEYTIKVYGAFSITQAGDDSNLIREIKIKVED